MQSANFSDQEPLETRTQMKIHTSALNEVVSVNSFFTAAVFLGLSMNATHQTSLVSTCIADEIIARELVVNEVISFSCFLLSTLVAQGLKLQITLTNLSKRPARHQLPWSPQLLRAGMVISAVGSLAGTVFLMLSMIDVLQLRLGVIRCDNSWAKKAVIPSVTLVSIGVLSFITPVLYTVIFK